MTLLTCLTPQTDNDILNRMVNDEFKVEYLVLKDGSCPFEEWTNNLSDKIVRINVLARIKRLKFGNFGDCKSISSAIRELRIDYGPGYRIYFSLRNKTVIVVLCAGSKKSQSKDIRKAQKLWETYKNAY